MAVKNRSQGRQQSADSGRSTRIKVVGGTIAAIVIGAIVVALINTNNTPREVAQDDSNNPSATKHDDAKSTASLSPLSIEGPTPVPQPVGPYTFSGGDSSKIEDLRQEFSSFEIVVRNASTSKVVLTSATFVPKQVINPVEEFRSKGGTVGRTTESIAAIDHTNHIVVPVGSLKAERDIDQPLGIPIEAESSVKFGLWYQYAPTGDHDPRNVAGTLTLAFDNGETISRELKMKFRPD